MALPKKRHIAGPWNINKYSKNYEVSESRFREALSKSRQSLAASRRSLRNFDSTGRHLLDRHLFLNTKYSI